MPKSLSHFQSRIWRCSFHSAVLWEYEHWKGVYQNLRKTSKSVKLESLVTMEGWVILPVNSHWTMNISAIFGRTAKYSGWLENNFLRSSLNFSCLIAAEKHAYCSGGKINFWSHLGEERPEKPQKFHRHTSRGRIESIKSAGKRSQKVTLTTFPRHFLETLISFRI